MKISVCPLGQARVWLDLEGLLVRILIRFREFLGRAPFDLGKLRFTRVGAVNPRPLAAVTVS